MKICWLKHYLAYPITIISLIIQRNLVTKIWAKQESGLTAVRLKWDPPVYGGAYSFGSLAESNPIRPPSLHDGEGSSFSRFGSIQ